MRWTLLLLVCLAGACARLCNRSNCDGCCASDTECVEGTSRLECGVGGEACVRCTSQERCTMARCEALPVADAGLVDAGPAACNCRTSCCLRDGSCAPNNGIDACGPVREYCGTCQPDQRCEQGACVSGPCPGCLDPLGACRAGSDATACGADGGVCVACGTDQVCNDGACEFISCDLSNCRFGCCMPNKVCLASSVTSCGLGGDPCVACAGTEQCLGGVCQ
jgi:hypothetical protein